MLKLDNETIAKISEEKMRCPIHLSVGQAVVGICSNLNKRKLAL